MKKIHVGIFPLLLVLYEMSVYLTNDSYLPGMPSMVKALGVPMSMSQLTFSLWILGGVIFQPIIGPLSDRYGRRAVLLSVGVIFLAASFACSIAPNITTLLIARFFQGLGVPGIVIPGYAAINELYEQTEAIKIQAKMSSVTVLAPSFGPLLGGVLLVFVSWRWIFGSLFIYALAVLASLYFKMPETLPIEKRPTSIKVKLICGQYSRLLRNVKFMQYIITGSFFVGGLVTWIVASPMLLISEHHYSTVAYGVFQLFVFGSFIIGMNIMKHYLTDKNALKLAKVGILIASTGAVLALLSAWLLPMQLFTFVAFMMIVAFGGGINFPIVARLAIDSSDEPMGIRISLLSMTRMGAAALCSIAVSLFFTGSLLSLALLIIAFSLFGALVMFSKR